MNDNDKPLDEQIRIKNKKKLVKQNLRLKAQVQRLQIEIDTLDNMSIEVKQDQSVLIHLKSQNVGQHKQIKRLKEVIEAEKHSNLKENIIFIRKEENQLMYLKKQLQNLAIEKSLVFKTHDDKLKQLSNNEPLLKQKEQLQNQWAKNKKQNRQLNLRMLQMEREVRKYHQIKEFSKASHPQSLNSNESQLIIVKAQIQRLKNEMKTIQNKWKSNIEQLDSQFFTQKSLLSNIQQKLLELQKDQQVWKRRAGALRDQSQLEKDRARMSKVIPFKNNEDVKVMRVQSKPLKTLSKNSLDDIQTIKKVNRLTKLAVSLSRAESSPNPPTSNKHLDLKLNDLLIPDKRQHRYKSNKESAQKSVGLINFQKAKLSLKQVENAHKVQINNQKIKQSQYKKMVLKEEEKNQNGRLSHRQKHKIKNITTSQLADSLKRKAEEVKQLNKKLQIEQLKSDKDKTKNKQKSVQKNLKQLSPKKKKSKNIIEVQTEAILIKKQKTSKSKKAKQSSLSVEKIDKNSIGKAKSIKQIQKNVLENKQKQRQLVQSLDLKLKKEPSLKQINAPLVKDVLKVESKNKIGSRQIKQRLQVAQLSKKSQNENQSAKYKAERQQNKLICHLLQNFENQANEQEKAIKSRVQIQLEDQDDNKPKIIKRKRPVEVNLTTTGTST